MCLWNFGHRLRGYLCIFPYFINVYQNTNSKLGIMQDEQWKIILEFKKSQSDQVISEFTVAVTSSLFEAIYILVQLANMRRMRRNFKVGRWCIETSSSQRPSRKALLMSSWWIGQLCCVVIARTSQIVASFIAGLKVHWKSSLGVFVNPLATRRALYLSIEP